MRFRPEEIADLTAMPSAGEAALPPVGPGIASRAGLRAIYAFGVVISLVALVWGAVQVLGSSDFVAVRLRDRAVAALGQLVGPGAHADVGPARLALDGGRLAIEFDDLKVKDESGAPTLSADKLYLGLRVLPLLGGRTELDSASLEGVRIAADRMGAGGGDWAAPLRDARGLIVPDKVVASGFAASDRIVSAIRTGSTQEVRLSDATITGLAGHDVRIGEAVLADSGDAVTIEAGAELDGISYKLSGKVDAPGAALAGTGFALAISHEPANAGDEQPSEPIATLTGAREKDGRNSSLRIAGKLLSASVNLGERGPLAGDLDFSATLEAGSNKLELDWLKAAIGRSHFVFNGAIGPAPEQPGVAPGYRFEVVSNDSLLAPEDSREEPMRAGVKLAGTLAADARRIDIPEIVVGASSGEASGHATLTLPVGRSPGIDFEIGLKDMSVEQVKQMWPWLAAGSARRWVMANLFGGSVAEGSVRYAVAEGRLDDTTPLGENEVLGRFVIRDSRFDTFGALPAIRDADGEINFAGSKVDIKLDSGAAYLASGKQLQTTNGKLTIADVRARPLIGKMELDVAGDASAMAEVASLEPISAMQKTGLAAGDLSGSAKGHVSADVPLQKGIDRSLLGWDVHIDYRHLDIARPLEGRRISDAVGSIDVDKSQVAIKAQANLDGIPAQLDILRPLGGGGPVKQNVKLVLDDKTRAALAPGLASILSGPVKVDITQDPGDGWRAQADLSAARLDLPWVGWSKGAGIPASASFLIADGGQQIRDFKLSGKPFGARGSFTLQSGGLQSAKLDNVSLNGADQFALTIARAGSGYKVNATGDAFDARSLIKALNDPAGAGSRKQSGATVTLDASIGSLTGFYDEALGNVSIHYVGAGGSASDLSLSGIARSGSKVRLGSGSDGSTRHMEASSDDAGALLRFLNLYSRVQGGSLAMQLSGQGTMQGTVDIRNFQIVNEPKLRSLVSTTPSGSDRNLEQATRGKIDASKVYFDRGYAEIQRGGGTLSIEKGVLRGPVIGTTFEGIAYDADNRMNLTGTFLPAYGLNSIFGDIPVLGALLGNGPNGGLIGITFRLTGDVKAPKLEVNPLSAIAPGIFRSIFEFRPPGG